MKGKDIDCIKILRFWFCFTDCYSFMFSHISRFLHSWCRFFIYLL